VVLVLPSALEMRSRPAFRRQRRAVDWVADVDALRVALPQDEFVHAHVLDDWLADLGVGLVGSVFSGDALAQLYPRMSQRAAFVTARTGFVDERAAGQHAALAAPHPARPLDVVYRARDAPFHLGRAAQAKREVVLAAQERLRERGLRIDLAYGEEATIYGPAWLSFLAASRATLGAISGASALDRRGELVEAGLRFRRANPGASFDDFASTMPAGWDGHDFGAIGPRHLEAAVVRTAQALVRGSYGGALEADTHYLAIDPDFGNLDTVIERLADPVETERVAARAHADLVASGRHTLARFARQLEAAMLPLLSESRRPLPDRRWAAIAAGTAAWSTAVVRPPRAAYRVTKRRLPRVARALRGARRRALRDGTAR
jgi:hypothetical protein